MNGFRALSCPNFQLKSKMFLSKANLVLHISLSSSRSCISQHFAYYNSLETPNMLLATHKCNPLNLATIQNEYLKIDFDETSATRKHFMRSIFLTSQNHFKTINANNNSAKDMETKKRRQIQKQTKHKKKPCGTFSSQMPSLRGAWNIRALPSPMAHVWDMFGRSLDLFWNTNGAFLEQVWNTRGRCLWHVRNIFTISQHLLLGLPLVANLFGFVLLLLLRPCNTFGLSKASIRRIF